MRTWRKVAVLATALTLTALGPTGIAAASDEPSGPGHHGAELDDRDEPDDRDDEPDQKKDKKSKKSKQDKKKDKKDKRKKKGKGKGKGKKHKPGRPPGHGNGHGPGNGPGHDHDDHEHDDDEHDDDERDDDERDDDHGDDHGDGDDDGDGDGGDSGGSGGGGGGTGGTGGSTGGSGGSGGSGGDTGTTSPDPGGFSFEVASFNILGSQHTAGSSRWASGVTRARMAKDWLRKEGTSVAGFSEGQVDQMRTLTSGGTWTSYPNPHQSSNTETAQSVAWLSARWTKVRASSFSIPFDVGQVRKQPMVLLEHRGTGRRVWFVSVHFTAGSGPRAVTERRIATARLVDNVRRLQRTGVPVIVTGDMNDRAAFFCRFTDGTGLVTPAGGSHGSTCSPPPGARIDWIFGSARLRWSGFRNAGDATLNRITDHIVPVATVHLPAN